MSAAPIGTSASTRCSTQSKPFSLGERAQPGAPMIGCAVESRRAAADCPDRPACRNASMRPPTASIAAGMTSRRSVIAEAPKTIDQSASERGAQAPARERRAVVRRRAPRATTRAPAGASRASRMRSVLSTTLGFRPGSSVETTPTRSGRNGATDTRRSPAAASAACERAALGGEGNDLDRRRPCRRPRRRDTARASPRVIASSTALTAVDRGARRRRPARPRSANRLTRPVKARSSAQMRRRRAARPDVGRPRPRRRRRARAAPR